MRDALATSAVLFAVLGVGTANGQTPTGTIAGVVTDPSRAALAGAQVNIISGETGETRTATSSADGTYSAASLPPGGYRVTAEVEGFKRLERQARIETGTTTTVDLVLELGDVSETVNVSGAAVPLIHHDHHQVAGVVTREQIENLPLNGRNFLELAKLEPGLTNPVRGTNNRTFVDPLGAGFQTIPRVGYTQVTVDGANINALGTIGAILQVSQEVVQEFQISTVNFDLSTGATTNGAVNIVTRSGGNAYRGGGFFFYRDHNMAAYPGLSRDDRNPDPFFERRQFGSSVGGPIRRDRAFFFTTYERNDQRGVVSVQPKSAELAPLGGIFPSPYLGTLFSSRVDARLSANHNAFMRYTHDGNDAFGTPNSSATVLPSGWSHLTNRVDQSIAALTSVLSANAVNDVRFSVFFLSTPESPVGSEACSGCLGAGGPRVSIPDAGIVFGQARTLSLVGHRFQLTDGLVWQKSRHSFRFGVDWEHASVTSSALMPTQVTLFSPAQARGNPTIALPTSFSSAADILQLPLQSFQASVGPSAPERDFGPDRVLDLYRLYASDTWRAGPRLTVNAGLAWFYEPNALNHDLTKPALLIPILGADGLNAPRVQHTNFSPALGFAWTATRDGKTVVHGGAGRYFDPAASTNSSNLANERQLLSPLGTGQLTVTGANILNNGRPLQFQQPTPYTGEQLLLDILPDTLAELARGLNPNNRDFSLRNLDRTKQGTNLYDPSYQTPSAVHLNLGVQREIGPGFVVSADAVWRRFIHTFINGIDYNRFASANGPVIPLCTDAQKTDDHAVCSNGPLMFDTTIGRAQYKGLLARVEKRFPGHGQLLASYALGSYVGTNGTGTGTAEISGGRVFGFNNDNWFENYGPLPTDRRHVLNVSGFVELPWHVQAAFSVSAYSRPPFFAYVAGVDFNGDGTKNDLLPGTTINAFNRGLGRDDLVRLVARYNQEFADKPLCCAQRNAPVLTLPDHYTLDEGFFTQDLRLTRTFARGRDNLRVSVFAEVFNLFNTPNLEGYSGNLANRDTFGQPSQRSTQVFGSGGPRACQLGARVSF